MSLTLQTYENLIVISLSPFKERLGLRLDVTEIYTFMDKKSQGFQICSIELEVKT